MKSKKDIFSTNYAEGINTQMQKYKITSIHISHYIENLTQMHHRPKYKSYNCADPRKKYRGNFCDLWLGKFL